MSQPLSRVKPSSRVPTLGLCGRPHRRARYCGTRWTRRGRRPWRVWTLFVQEPGELGCGRRGIAGPCREGEEPKPVMNASKQSDPAIVAMKPTNKAGSVTAAESVEPRVGTEGNVDQQSTHRTQTRARVSQALGSVRQAAKASKASPTLRHRGGTVDRIGPVGSVGGRSMCVPTAPDGRTMAEWARHDHPGSNDPRTCAPGPSRRLPRLQQFEPRTEVQWCRLPHRRAHRAAHL